MLRIFTSVVTAELSLADGGGGGGYYTTIHILFLTVVQDLNKLTFTRSSGVEII